MVSRKQENRPHASDKNRIKNSFFGKLLVIEYLIKVALNGQLYQ
jgi:hypothetical protein